MNIVPIYQGKWNETYKESVTRQTLLRSRRSSGRRDGNEILLYKAIANIAGSIVFGTGLVSVLYVMVVYLGC